MLGVTYQPMVFESDVEKDARFQVWTSPVGL